MKPCLLLHPFCDLQAFHRGDEFGDDEFGGFYKLWCQISQIKVNYLNVVESRWKNQIEHTKIQSNTFYRDD